MGWPKGKPRGPRKKVTSKVSATQEKFKSTKYKPDLVYVPEHLKEAGYTYRLVHEKHLRDGAEDGRGWEPVTVYKGIKGSSLKPEDGIKNVSGTYRKGDLILCRMEEDKAQSIRDYIQAKVDKKVMQIKRGVKGRSGFNQIPTTVTFKPSKD